MEITKTINQQFKPPQQGKLYAVTTYVNETAPCCLYVNPNSLEKCYPCSDPDLVFMTQLSHFYEKLFYTNLIYRNYREPIEIFSTASSYFRQPIMYLWK